LEVRVSSNLVLRNIRKLGFTFTSVLKPEIIEIRPVMTLVQAVWLRDYKQRVLDQRLARGYQQGVD
jgi:hypothetical protein